MHYNTWKDIQKSIKTTENDNWILLVNHIQTDWIVFVRSTPAGTDRPLWKDASPHQYKPLCHEEECGSEYAGRCLADGQLLPAQDCSLCGASLPFLHSPHRPAVSVHHITGHSGAASHHYWQVMWMFCIFPYCCSSYFLFAHYRQILILECYFWGGTNQDVLLTLTEKSRKADPT